jgi:DNA-binding transcriptional regulator GbsR (MarR family)
MPRPAPNRSPRDPDLDHAPATTEAPSLSASAPSSLVPPPSSPSPASYDPTQLEEEVIHFFVQFAASVSIPKSIGELFGTLFCSENALPFEEIVSRTGMSKGSTSQGLKFLQKIKAVSTVYVARDRRTFYQAETSLRRLAGGILNETVRPRLETNEDLIEEIQHLLHHAGEEHPAFLHQRIDSLQTWNKKAKRLLPWLIKLTGGSGNHDGNGKRKSNADL